MAAMGRLRTTVAAHLRPVVLVIFFEDHFKANEYKVDDAGEDGDAGI